MSKLIFRRFLFVVTALVFFMAFIWIYRKMDLDDSRRTAAVTTAVIGNPVTNIVLNNGPRADVHTTKTKASTSHPLQNHLEPVLSVLSAVIPAQSRHKPSTIPGEITLDGNPVPAGQPMPTLQVLKTLDRRQLSQIYHNYVNSAQMSCKNMVRRGNAGDGGWDVCEDPPYGMKTPCNIYSFGINYDWSFDDAVATAYGCHVHSYDPSMTRVSDHDRRSNIHFHKTGLNSSDSSSINGWRMRTFSSILKENNHTQATIDLLKIDIEASEWFAFPEMLQSGSLKNLKQFCFELHIKLGNAPEPDIDKYLTGLELLRDFYNAGFRIFHTHKNMDAKYKSMFGMERTGCHEIYMVRSDTQTFG